MMDVELAASLLAALMPELLAAAGRRSRSVALGRSGQRAQGRDRVGTWCRWSQLKADLSPGAREPDRRQRASAEPRRDARRPPTIAEGDFFFFERNAPKTCVATIKQLVQHRLIGDASELRDPREIQVLTPMNRGPLGTHALNHELQALLNPAGREIRAGDRTFREGDRVIQLRNNYDKLVFNGAIGRIVGGRSRARPRRRRVRGRLTPNTIWPSSTSWRSPTRSRCTRARAASIPRS